MSRRWRWAGDLRSAWALLFSATLCQGCGGASPLFHPAHVLSQGSTTMAAGAAAQLTAGESASAIQSGREATTSPLGQQSDYDQAALAIASLAPGVSPYVGARVGLGYSSEAGLSYTGRALRVDGRIAKEFGPWALSAGVGGAGVLSRRDGSESGLRDLDLSGVHGYGFDIPLLAGWRSDAGLFSVWAGPRGGLEILRGSIGLGNVTALGVAPSDPVPLEVSRWFVGGVFGFQAGFRHLFVALEVDAAYNNASGSFGDKNVSVKGFTVAPGGALVIKF